MGEMTGFLLVGGVRKSAFMHTLTPSKITLLIALGCLLIISKKIILFIAYFLLYFNVDVFLLKMLFFPVSPVKDVTIKGL
jgi:hypothetical protein